MSTRMSRAVGVLLRRPRTVLFLVLVCAAAGAAGWVYWSRSKTTDLLRQGEQALGARDYPRAREHLDRYLALRPDDAHAHLLAARAARRMRDYPAAREHLRRCRERGGPTEPIVVEEALAEVQRGDEQPVAFLRERAKRDDDLALVILEVLIQHDLDTYQLRAALDGFTRYLAHRPDDLQALLGRGYVWERLLSFPDAVEDYRAAVAAHPDNPQARLKLAETLLIAGTPDEAVTHFRWLAERWPTRVEVRLGLARCSRRLGDPAEAAKQLDAILAEAPEHGEVLWERGELELEQGRAPEAEPLLRRAALRLPHDRRVHYSLARCLLRLDRKAEAEEVNARVAQLDADVRRLGEIAQKVIERPNDAALRCEGGLLFLRNGEREQGIRWLQLALRIDPECEPARAALAAELQRPSAP
jgi:tetratricopeptide (TPR) repeat protein